MAKTTKDQRKALNAMDAAADAVKQANKAAKSLPSKTVKKLRGLSKDADDAAHPPKSAIRKKPGKVAERASRAADKLLKATAQAVDKAKKKARERAAADKKAAAAKAAKKAAARTARTAAREADTGPGVLATEPASLGDIESSDAAAPAEAAPEASAPKVPARKPAVRKTPAPKTPAPKTPAPKTPAPKTPARTAAASTSSELSSLTVVALRDRAKAAGKTGYSRLTKEQLVALLS